ncbi:MAG: bifunctional phosphoribosylaminoimidazolecarboxamide formyltransferase/IMP cyclohydrolase [Gammaproteobacteria bacterium]|nr:bifunctional phosphoribosylaminoimidazolecarboxamide formyltransferase/IMP cyclohydrolase [Gammaproteobacteria bacterium]
MSEIRSPGKRYALLSVSDKTGITELAKSLAETGFTLLSTGGTARALRQAGLEVTDVSAHTGFPEIMDGRVKTLHPVIHGGILGRDQDIGVMADHGISAIELVIVNLYPFEAVTSKPGCSRDEAIENIDIGGPAMLRAAAKNHARVTVVTDPTEYATIVTELAEKGSVSESSRARLAAQAFAHTSRYDSLVAGYLQHEAQPDEQGMPVHISPCLSRRQSLRYGENPHQSAALYSAANQVDTFRQLQGKPLSYNNIADADAALECVRQFSSGPACIIVKHANPCGGARAANTLDAYDRAYQTDPVSSFGGVIAFNQVMDQATAGEIISRQFVEVLVAPGFEAGALETLAGKPNIRVLQSNQDAPPPDFDFHAVAGGVLVQEHDLGLADRSEWRCVTGRQPESTEWDDLEFAWKMVRMVKSNAIIYAREHRTLGIGAGQMSRVDSSRIAAWKAEAVGLDLAGSAMASDAFFPFRDGIDTAAAAGARSVIQPGGSMRDEEVIAAANEHGMAMVFTGKRHFRH